MNKIVAFGLVLLLPSLVGAQELVCPGSVAVSESVRELPAGWESVARPEPHTFDRVSVYYRHPREMGSQVPDNEGSKQAPEWRFVDGKSEQYWMACEYHTTGTLLARQLPAGLSRCAATRQGLRCK